MVSGVPDGRREKSVCFQCDVSPSFSHHRISAYQNPRFTEEAEKRSIEQFGGKESQDFIQMILGEHGTPVYALFDRENMRMEDYYYPALRIYGSVFKNEPFTLDRLVVNLPTPPRASESLVLGVDLGYTQPSSLIALYSKEDCWYILFRVELHQVNYDLQEKFIDDLHTKYNFHFIGLDVGAGGQGKAIYNDMINRPEYKNRDYVNTIVEVEFGGTIVVGSDEEGKELKERIKPFAVTKLQQMTNSYKIAYSKRDEDLLTELERITYSKSSATSQVVYKATTPGGGDRGDDHNFAALLTYAMVIYQKFDAFDSRSRKPKLLRSRWLF